MDIPIEAIEKLPARFLNKVDFTDTCWLWNRSLVNYGYGVYRSGDKMVRPHRFSWEKFNGEILNGLLVCHKCDVRSCVNPNHLFLGTHKDNLQDMYKKGRRKASHGEKHYRSKLKDSQIQEIKELYSRGRTKFNQRELSEIYKIERSVISRIVNGKAYKDAN